MTNSRTSNVIKNSGAGLLYRAAHMIVQFAMRTAFIHLLGKEYTGVSSLFTDILHVLSLMELGLDTSMTFALYGPIASNDKRKISALLNYYRKAFNVIGVVVLAAGVACLPFLDYIVKGVPNIKEDIRYLFLMYVITTASSYFFVYRTILLRAEQRSRVISNINTIIAVVECVVEIILLIIIREFFAYLFLHLFFTVLRNVIISRRVKKEHPEFFIENHERLQPNEKSRLYRDMVCLGVYNLSGVVINSTDSIFISAFVGTVEVAIIGNFTLVINSVRNCVQQIVTATKPSIGNLAATSNTEKQEQIFERMNFLAFSVSCFCCTCLFSLLNPFVGDIWFDPNYKIPLTIVSVLVVNFFIAVMVFPVESFRTANGLFVQGWYRPVIMAVLNIVLDFYMGKRWGIGGIFLATTISRLLTQVWFDPFLVYRLVFNKSLKHYIVVYFVYALITAISCGLVHFICGLIPFSNVFLSFVCKAIVSAVLPIAVIVLVFHNSENYHYTRDLMVKLFKKVTGCRNGLKKPS